MVGCPRRLCYTALWEQALESGSWGHPTAPSFPPGLNSTSPPVTQD